MGLRRETRTWLVTSTGIVGACLVSTGARSADLPAKSAAPIEYVRICSAYSAGFFSIPGTDTCLRLAGRVRAEIRYLEPGTRADDDIGYRARGRIDIDARTPTSYGMLRTFIRYELTRNTGNYGANTTNLERAFVQFGGLTAGRTQSFFDFYTNEYNFGSIFVSDFPTQVFAYTATPGSDLSATISLEDGIERRQFTNPNGDGFPGQGFLSAGERMPDIVGRLLWEPDWGKAQLSAALHQIRSDNLVPDFGVARFPGTEYGFAVQGGLQIKLPAIAEGDELWLQGAYSEGALSYLGIGRTSIKEMSLGQTDAYIDEFGRLRRSSAWAGTALFLHYWTPQIRQVVFGSYGRIDYPANGATSTQSGNTVGFIETADWRIGSNIGWLPVRGLYIGIESLYRRVDLKGRVFAGGDAAGGRLIDSAEAFETRLRVQRDF